MRMFTECNNTACSKIRDNAAVSLQSVIQICCTPSLQIVRKGWIIFNEIMQFGFVSRFHTTGDEISPRQDERC